MIHDMTVTRSLSPRTPHPAGGGGGGGSGSILKLHEDVQTCGYRDVQVMFDILTLELEASTQRPAVKHQQQQQRKRRPPPPPWPSHRSSSVIAAAQ